MCRAPPKPVGGTGVFIPPFMIKGGALQGKDAKRSGSGASHHEQKGSGSHDAHQSPSDMLCCGVPAFDARTRKNCRNKREQSGIINDPLSQLPAPSTMPPVAEEAPYMYAPSWSSFSAPESPVDGFTGYDAFMLAFDEVALPHCQPATDNSSFSSSTGSMLCQQLFGQEAQETSLEADLQSIDTAVQQLLAQKQFLLDRRAAQVCGNEAASTAADPVMANLVFQQEQLMKPAESYANGTSAFCGGMSVDDYNQKCVSADLLASELAAFERLSLLPPAAPSLAPSSANVACCDQAAKSLLQYCELEQTPPTVPAATGNPATFVPQMSLGLVDFDVQVLQDAHMVTQTKLLEYIEMCQLEATLQNELLQLLPPELLA